MNWFWILLAIFGFIVVPIWVATAVAKMNPWDDGEINEKDFPKPKEKS